LNGEALEVEDHADASVVHSAQGYPVAASDDLCSRVLKLPLEEREVLILVVVERLSYADVASVLGVQVGTVMATLTRAREDLSEAQS
jgi:RNA polymerase sigma factor (sigma-70 family)